ncbi:MAG TPA: stage II sporulation protein P [Sphingobacteriaceae bacterium]|nr:stage II sporulation protein P [Sphingobacteriaceae bacterium]
MMGPVVRAAQRGCLLLGLALLVPSLPATGHAASPHAAAAATPGAETSAYRAVVDDRGNVLFHSAREWQVGDEFLDGENRLFTVAQVTGSRIILRPIGRIRLPGWRIFPGRLRRDEPDRPGPGEKDPPKGLVGIYHTHNGESYVPDTGTHSTEGAGDIHRVGKAFARALEKAGVAVIHDETLHLPHDDEAYSRSRVTAVNLLRREPTAIFDVHRDATPPEVYRAQVAGMDVTKIAIVVGRQNPQFAVNRRYALSLKGVVDKVHPGLIGGVLFLNGNFNQDLSPFNLLIEVGAHTNSRAEAERAVTLFAEAVAFYFFGPVAQGSPQVAYRGLPGSEEAVGRTLAALLGLTLLGGAAYVFWRTVEARP